MSDEPYRIPASRVDQAINVDPRLIGARVGFVFATGAWALLIAGILSDRVGLSEKMFGSVVVAAPWPLLLVLFGWLWGMLADRTLWHVPWVASLQGIVCWVTGDALIELRDKLQYGLRDPSSPLPPVLYLVGTMGVFALAFLMMGLVVRWRVSRAFARDAD